MISAAAATPITTATISVAPHIGIRVARAEASVQSRKMQAVAAPTAPAAIRRGTTPLAAPPRVSPLSRGESRSGPYPADCEECPAGRLIPIALEPRITSLLRFPLVSRQRSTKEESERGSHDERRTGIVFDERLDVRHHAFGIVTAHVVGAGADRSAVRAQSYGPYRPLASRQPCREALRRRCRGRRRPLTDSRR